MAYESLNRFSGSCPWPWDYHLCRLAMLTHPSLADPTILIEFGKGAAFAVVLLPVGYRVLGWGIQRSKNASILVATDNVISRRPFVISISWLCSGRNDSQSKLPPTIVRSVSEL
jgi:hypothetical protein